MTALLLLLPLAVLFYNVKVHWVFSQYTTLNFMLFTGMVYLALYPSLPGILAYFLSSTRIQTCLAGFTGDWGRALTSHH